MGRCLPNFLFCLLLANLALGQLNDGKPIPKIIWGEYDSNVLVIMEDLEPTAVVFLVEERYDVMGQQGSLTTQDHGKATKFNYFTKTDQTFYLDGTKCTVGTLLDHKGINLYGWDYTSGNDDPPLNNFVYGPSAWLKRTEDYEKDIVYIGQEYCRNISADHWQLKLAEGEGYTIDYWYTRVDWSTPYMLQPSPLLITVEGLEGNPWDQSAGKKKQLVNYEFLDFKPFTTPKDWDSYEVRGGYDCPNRKTLDPKQTTPPTPSNQVKVFLETMTNKTEGQSGVVFRSWLYYDSFRKLMRLDMDGEYVIGPQNIEPKRNVQDMAAGVEYVINRWTGGCKSKTWSQNDFAALIGAEIADVLLADDKTLFKLDDKYVFSGHSENRGLSTMRWSATRKDVKGKNGKNHKKVVVDYHFLSRYVDDIGEYTSSPLPVRIDITIYKDDNTDEIQEVQTVDLLHLQTSFESYELNPFDIRDCFSLPTQRSWFKIYFSGEWNKGAAQNQDMFKKDILLKIVEHTGISYTRVPTIELDHDYLFTYAHVLVLEPADYLLQFQPPEKAKPWTHDNQVSLKINDATVCAAECLTHHHIGFDCLAFYECNEGKGKKNCYVSSSKQVKTPSADVSECQHYVLSANTPDFQVPNLGVFLYIFNASINGDFVFKYQYKDEFGKMREGSFNGVYVEDEIYADDPTLLNYLKGGYHVAHRHAYLAKHVKTDMTGSYDACKLACDTATSYECESFAYCYDSEQCQLSDFVVSTPVDKADVVYKEDCIIMGRTYLEDYRKIPGSVYISDPKQTVEKVYLSEHCAYLCDSNEEFTCRSFDYCRDTRTCYQYVERSIDIPDEKVNHSIPNCDHYERNALVDFTKHENKVLEKSRDATIEAVTATECADTCEQQPDYKCLGFDYCYKGSVKIPMCYLTVDNYNDAGVEVKSSSSCDHFARSYYDGKSRNEFSHTKYSEYKYGPGDMAGLGVSMLVISIALTFAGVYVYNSKSK